MRMAVAVVLACGLVTAFAAPAGAQTSSQAAPPAASPPASAPQLEEVLVTGQSLEDDLPQQLSQYGTRVTTVTSGQIESGGYIDVASALENLTPGLYITSGNGPFDYVQVSLQGSRTEDVLWLVDGVRINNRLYAGTTPLDTIPASMIDHIEVLDGGQALFYGTQAMAGAVNIVTRPFTDHPQGAWSVGLDSNDGKHMDGYFSDGLDQNDFVLYATHDESPGIQPFPTADFQPSGTERHRPYDVTTLGLKYGYNFADDLALSALVQHTNATVGFAEPMLTALAYNQRDETLASSRLDYDPSDAFKLYVKDYYHWWYSYYTEYDNGSTPYVYTPGTPGEITVVNSDDFWGFKDYGVNLLTQFDLNRGFEYLAGYDFQGYTGRDAVLVIQQETEHVNAFFGQIRTTPDLIPDAHLAAGLRYNVPSFGQSALVWNGSGQYDISKSLYVRTTFGTTFRLPTDEELFANDPDDERGDPNLKPETSTSANLAVGGSLIPSDDSSLKWEVTGFYRRIRNLIECGGFDAATDQCLFENVPGDVRVMGEELTLEASISAALSATLDATNNHSRESGSDLQFDEVPANQVKAGLDYHPAGAWYGAGFTLVRVGNLDDEPFGPGAGRFGYGNYTNVDLNGHIFLDQRHHQRIDIHVDNVFNHVYYTALGTGVNDTTGADYVVHDLALPRTFQVNYTYHFQ